MKDFEKERNEARELVRGACKFSNVDDETKYINDVLLPAVERWDAEEKKEEVWFLLLNRPSMDIQWPGTYCGRTKSVEEARAHWNRLGRKKCIVEVYREKDCFVIEKSSCWDKLESERPSE